MRIILVRAAYLALCVAAASCFYARLTAAGSGLIGLSMAVFSWDHNGDSLED